MKLKDYLGAKSSCRHAQVNKFNRDGSIKCRADFSLNPDELREQNKLKEEMDELHDEFEKISREVTEYIAINGSQATYDECKKLSKKSRDASDKYLAAINAYFEARSKSLKTNSQCLSDKDFVNLTPTNDLHSKTRALASYIVWCANKNRQISENKQIDDWTKRHLRIDIDKNIADYGICQCYRTATVPYEGRQITPLHLLCSTNIKSFNYNFVFESFGVNYVCFSEEKDNQLKFPSKKFFNDMTIIDEEGASVEAPLSLANIIDPFGAIICHVGANRHARLAVRDYDSCVV